MAQDRPCRRPWPARSWRPWSWRPWSWRPWSWRPRSWRPRLRRPRGSARLRLTVLYGAAFLMWGAGGAAVLAVTYLLSGHVGNPDGTGPASGHTPRAYWVIRVAGGRIMLDRQQMLIASGIIVTVFVVAAVALGWLLAGRVLRPLRTITAAARRISASSLHERLALHGPDDELKELADTLDGLFARLEESFEAQRRFAASASHELRTPLTRERALIQVTLADPDTTVGTWQAVSRELLAANAEQEQLIDAILTLASSEGAPGEHEPVDLAAVASADLAAARPAIGRHGLRVEAGLRPAVLDGDPLLVQQLVTNLIGNAVRHNVPGGDIQIATATSGAGAVLSVANSGPVIPADEVDRLFQPFQRLGPRPARRDGGHGLGLSIVRAIAAAHGAAVTARPRPGGGLVIEVSFPREIRLPQHGGMPDTTGCARATR